MLRAPVFLEIGLGVKHKPTNNMFKIVMNNDVIAVSETMESAIKALPDLICTYADIGNSNLIEWLDKGVIVNVQYNVATAKVKVIDTDFDIFICKINVV